MTSIRTSDEFFRLSAAAQAERASLVAAQAAAKRLIKETMEEAHLKTVRAAAALLAAGGSEYMLGQATGMVGYAQRRKLAEEARNLTEDATDDDALTQPEEVANIEATPSFSIASMEGDMEGTYEIGVGSNNYFYLYAVGEDLFNGEDPHGNVKDSIGALTELGIMQEVEDEILGN